MSDVHTTHCCALHGCKYGHEDCTVYTLAQRQEYKCEECGYKPRLFDPIEIVWSLDFLSYELLTVKDIPEILDLAQNVWMFGFPEAKGGHKRIMKSAKDFPAELQKRTQLVACAYRYAQWVSEHMFRTKWER